MHPLKQALPLNEPQWRTDRDYVASPTRKDSTADDLEGQEDVWRTVLDDTVLEPKRSRLWRLIEGKP